MNPVQIALWVVENHSSEPLTLEQIAQVSGVSSFHLTRAFAAATGLSLMRYLRARRLSEAARRLTQGAENILGVALEAGYGSHEAFTRAFREQFALTPEQVRTLGQLDNLYLVEAISMDTLTNSNILPTLVPPRFEMSGPLQFAGLVERYDCQAPAGIPAQWQRFTPYLGTIPQQANEFAYGVGYNFDEEGYFDYMCAVAVKNLLGLPTAMQTLQVPPQKYVVFTHHDHISNIRATLAAIWNQWFPTSGYQSASAPMFERYGPEFNPSTGTGGLEIWIPLANQ